MYKEVEIIKFKTILTYYLFLGTQVYKFESKLIFANQINIFKTERGLSLCGS